MVPQLRGREGARPRSPDIPSNLVMKTKKTNSAKRLSAYSSLAAATAVAGGSANAAEVVWDISDLAVASGDDVLFNMVSGTAAPTTSTGVNTPSSFMLRVTGDLGIMEADTEYNVVGLSGVWASSYDGVTALGSGTILPTANFVGYSSAAALGSASNSGWGFAEGQTGFVGVKFEISGSTHYGWAQLTRDDSSDNYILHGFGYNDTAGAGSQTSDTVDLVPEPSSIALLALGATGLMRRRRQKAA